MTNLTNVNIQNHFDYFLTIYTQKHKNIFIMLYSRKLDGAW